MESAASLLDPYHLLTTQMIRVSEKQALVLYIFFGELEF